MSSMFLTAETPPRLRLLWRLLGFGVLIFACNFLFLIPVLVLQLLGWNSEPFIMVQVASGVATAVAVFIARWLLDRRSIRSLGLALNRRALIDLGVGILLAAVMMALIFTASWAAGWLRVTGFGWETANPAALLWRSALWGVLFIAVGFYEELMTRGYILQNLEDGLNTFWAVIISSAIFGLLHVDNPGAGWVAVVGITAAGLMFAYGYLRTRSLWLAIGLHIGWNFFEGVVFGFPVSGLETARFLEIEVAGPAAWTGGAFGPEAGLVMLPALLAGVALIHLYTRGRGATRVAETTP